MRRVEGVYFSNQNKSGVELNMHLVGLFYSYVLRAMALTFGGV